MDYLEYSIEKIKRIRIEKNLTQEQFADLLEIDYETYTLIEQGLYQLTPILLLQIANKLKINFTEFNKDFQ